MYGADQVSQDFLDQTIEANIAGCGHAAPDVRPDPRVVPKPKAKPKRKAIAQPKPPGKRWWRWPPPPEPET